jgi:hypothetical protein
MDLHPYNTVCHNTMRHDNCHTCMHGLIHDGWLRACQSCLLRLMYIFRLLYVIRCLWFQLVGGYIKGQAFSFFC